MWDTLYLFVQPTGHSVPRAKIDELDRSMDLFARPRSLWPVVIHLSIGDDPIWEVRRPFIQPTPTCPSWEDVLSYHKFAPFQHHSLGRSSNHGTAVCHAQ